MGGQSPPYNRSSWLSNTNTYVGYADSNAEFGLPIRCIMN